MQQSRTYPWFIAVVGMLTLMMSNGLAATAITTFDPSLLSDFGWSRADFKFRDALTFWIAGVLAPVMGLLVDRYNPKYLIAAGMACLTLGYLAYASISNGGSHGLVAAIVVLLIALYSTLAWIAWRSWLPRWSPLLGAVLIAALAALAGWGYVTQLMCSAIKQILVIHLLFAFAVAAAGGPVVIVLVSSWFLSHRGLALGIALAGTSLGSAVIPNISAPLLAEYDWRAVFRIESLLPLSLLVLVLLAVRGLPRHAGAKAVGQAASQGDLKSLGLTFQQAIRTRTFWAICISGFLTFFAIFGFVQHLVLHMTQGLDYSLAEATRMLLLYSLLALTAKILSGLVADRIDRHLVFYGCLAVMLVGLLGLATMRREFLVPAVVAIGIGWGGLFTIYSMLAVGNFGLRELGRIHGIINLFETFGVGTGSWVVGWLYDRSGNYQAAFLVLCAVVGIGLLLATQVRSEVERTAAARGAAA